MEETELHPLEPVIPVKVFTEFFSCTICMEELKESTITICGHRFCSQCIKEWVGRRHKCPCCNNKVELDQLIRDREYDSLIGAVTEEKDKSENNYFDQLINRVSQSDGDNELLSPVEEVLKRHLKQSLAAHERYFQILNSEFQQKMKKLEEQTQVAIDELKGHGLSDQEVIQQTEDLKNTLDRQKLQLENEMGTSTNLVAEAFDKHLTNHIPTLDVLPVKVSFSFLEKEIRIPDIIVKPSESIEDVIAMVEAIMFSKNDPIHNWSDVRFVLFGPFAKCSFCEMKQKVCDILQSRGTVTSGIQFLLENSKPVLQHGMKPGSEIAVYGSVKFQSDLPKRCFVQMFKKGDGHTVDYFNCKNCGFQWICRSCMEVCHKGHELVPHIIDHHPTWACCYCPKKKTCRIQNNT